MKHFVFQPNPTGDLTYCKAPVNKMFGNIRASWVVKDQGLLVDLEIPLNSSDSFVLPCRLTAIVDESEILGWGKKWIKV